jgi:hypothetical protein
MDESFASDSDSVSAFNFLGDMLILICHIKTLLRQFDNSQRLSGVYSVSNLLVLVYCSCLKQ